MTRDHLTLSARLAGKKLVGFDTSAWGQAGEARDAAAVDVNCGQKLGRAAKVPAKIGVKVGGKPVLNSKVGIKPGAKATSAGS